MKLTTSQLRQIIREEMAVAMGGAAPAGAPLPESFLDYRRLVLDQLRAAGAPEQFIEQVASEGTPASLALETGWMGYEDKAVYMTGKPPAALWKALSDAAHATVMGAGRKYKAGKGPKLDPKPLADAVRAAVLNMGA